MGASWQDYLDTPLHVIDWDLGLSRLAANLARPEQPNG